MRDFNNVKTGPDAGSLGAQSSESGRREEGKINITTGLFKCE